MNVSLPNFRHSHTLLLATVLLLLLGTKLQAQQVVASSDINLSNESRYEVFAQDNGSIIVYRDEPGKVLLDAFTSNLEPAWSRELSLDKAKPSPIGAVVANNEVNVFYTFRKNRELFLKLHRYSERGNLSDSLIVTALEDEFLTPSWRLASNPDSEVAVLWNQRDSDTYLFMGVEISTGRLLYKKVVQIDFGPLLGRQIHDVYVDREGSGYLWVQENNRKSKIEEHKIKLLQIKPTGDVKAVLASLPETLIFDIQVSVDELNQQVVLGGYYALDPDEAAGSIVMRVPMDFEGEIVMHKVPFTQEQLLAVDQKAKSPEGVKDLAIIDILFRRDGTAVLIGEQRKATLRTVGGRTGYFGGTLKTDYLYEDVVISTVTPEGTGTWQEVLPKKQFSQDDGAAFSGYFVATSPNTLHLIYNDEVRSGGTVSEYSITGTGGIERHSLMNTEYQDLWLRLQAGVQLDANTVIIPSERRNRLRLVRIEF